MPITRMMIKKKRGFPLGCLFWVALLLLVFVVFLFNRKTIEQVLKSTNFFNLVSRGKEEKEPGGPETGPEDVKPEPGPAVTTQPEKVEPEVKRPVNVQPEPVKPEPQAPSLNVRNAKLFFIDVNQDGQINLKSVIRPVTYSDSPLTETLRALLKGLLPSELNMELLTLIPEHTELRSVRMSGGTVYLDFNESFQFNSLGREGHIAQLKQVVYTATEFPSVKNVQILIDGEEREFLGPEGVFIGKPLTRESF
ncbi:MAG: hypothetical protein E4H36_03470 [Spirochaetales bacterium]|nr:MAG: hypothetical protein E4H36_03470 [Spirochaetales bacterium]